MFNHEEHQRLLCSHLIKKFLQDFLFSEEIYKQTVLKIRNVQYNLYKPVTNFHAENISKTILNLPEKDVIEIFGFSINLEPILNYEKTYKIMKCIKTHQKKIGKIDNFLIDQITQIDGENFVTNLEKQYKNEKNPNYFVKNIWKIYYKMQKKKNQTSKKILLS